MMVRHTWECGGDGGEGDIKGPEIRQDSRNYEHFDEDDWNNCDCNNGTNGPFSLLYDFPSTKDGIGPVSVILETPTTT